MKEKYKSLTITKPHNCIIAFGIPTTKGDFFSSLETNNREFAQKFRLWDEYYDDIVHPFSIVKSHYNKLGVKVVECLNISQLHELFVGNDTYVIILFSHWKEKMDDLNRDEGAIEFFDGFSNSSKIIKQVPIDYTGVLDLCICKPNTLVENIKKERPSCITRYAQQTATPLFWLYFYLAIFYCLTNGDKTYLDAFTETALSFAGVN